MRSPSAQRGPGWTLRFAVITACAAVAIWASVAWTERHQGRDLFEGRTALIATLAGHEDPLPATAAACSNCHRSQAGVGPALSARALQKATPRRGGPPSSYTQATFCKTLRTGIDPAFVLLLKTMPRYRLSDEQCQALWSHSTRS